jgi:hypothetical protein
VQETEASASVNHPGITGIYVVLELQEGWNGALVPALQEEGYGER